MKQENTLFFTLCLFLSGPFYGWAQTQPTLVASKPSPTIFHHFADNQVSHITLTTDLTTLITEKKKAHLLDATLLLESKGGHKETMDLKVELRGRNRRKVCSIPPMRLDFSKKELSEIGLSETGDKLKLVTHCKDEYGMDYLLREYWAYRLFNEMTPVSFQVYLLNINYVDTKAPNETLEEQLAFLIESEEELAARFNCSDEKIWGLNPEQIEKKSYYYNLLFQYMIGNDDWELKTIRNLSFIQQTKEDPPVIIPYDFDFAGLVDAPYAIANPNLSGKRVTDRVVMGHFASKEDLHEVIDDFMKAKPKILSCYEACTWMSEESKDKMRMYLEDFYKELGKTKKMERLFVKKR